MNEKRVANLLAKIHGSSELAPINAGKNEWWILIIRSGKRSTKEEGRFSPSKKWIYHRRRLIKDDGYLRRGLIRTSQINVKSQKAKALVKRLWLLSVIQLYGSGFLQGVQTQSDTIPEIHTDFIFTVIGEEFGFIGATILLVTYFFLFYRMVIIALTCNNLFGTYLERDLLHSLFFDIPLP